MTLTPGEIIRTVRRRHDWTLRDVQDLTGVSISTLSRIERNKPAEWSAVAAVGLQLRIDLNDLARAEMKMWEVGK